MSFETDSVHRQDSATLFLSKTSLRIPLRVDCSKPGACLSPWCTRKFSSLTLHIHQNGFLPIREGLLSYLGIQSALLTTYELQLHLHHTLAVCFLVAPSPLQEHLIGIWLCLLTPDCHSISFQAHLLWYMVMFSYTRLSVTTCLSSSAPDVKEHLLPNAPNHLTDSKCRAARCHSQSGGS